MARSCTIDLPRNSSAPSFSYLSFAYRCFDMLCLGFPSEKIGYCAADRCYYQKQNRRSWVARYFLSLQAKVPSEKIISKRKEKRDRQKKANQLADQRNNIFHFQFPL